MSARAEAPGRASRPIPRDPAPDSSIALLREGYGFIPARCQRFRADLFGALALHQHRVAYLRDSIVAPANRRAS